MPLTAFTFLRRNAFFLLRERGEVRDRSGRDFSRKVNELDDCKEKEKAQLHANATEPYISKSAKRDSTPNKCVEFSGFREKPKAAFLTRKGDSFSHRAVPCILGDRRDC